MKKIYLFTLAIFLLGVTSTRAQNTAGKEFWVTFGANYLASTECLHYPEGQLDMKLRIATQDALSTDVTIRFTGLTAPADIVVFRNLPSDTVLTHTLTLPQKQAVYNTITGSSYLSSIHITSTEPITAYAINIGSRSTDATNILPITALGTEYYQISYKPKTKRSCPTNNPPASCASCQTIPIPDVYDAYAVIATEDATEIFHEGTLVTTLDKGEVYYRTDINDMTGQLVTSTNKKPVAFFALNQNVSIGTQTSGDCLMQQLSPVNTWGKKFFVPVSNRGPDIVRIVASKPNTTITASPPPVSLITAGGGQSSLVALEPGEWVEFEVSGSGCYIQADFRVGVCTYLKSQGGSGNAKSDPSQAWLPAIEQMTSEAMIAPFIPDAASTSNLKPTSGGEHYALIITPTATAPFTEVYKNGVLQSPSPLTGWKNHQDGEFSFCELRIDDGSDNPNISYTFKNDNKLLVMGYGIGSAESYYYLGFAAQRDLNVIFDVNDEEDWTDQLFCERSFDITVNIEDFDEDEDGGSLTWYIDGNENTACKGSLSCSFPNLSIGEHTIRLEYIFDGEDRFVERILEVGAITSVSVLPNGSGTVNVSDTCVASGKPLTLTATPASAMYKFSHWSEGNATSSTNPSYSFPVSKDRDLVANFKLNTYKIELEKIPQDGGRVFGYDDEVPYGEPRTIIAAPFFNYDFLGWTDKYGEDISDLDTCEIIVTCDTILYANFQLKSYEIKVLRNNPGGGWVSGGGENIPYDSLITVQAIPRDDYKFIEWQEDDELVSSNSSYTFNVTRARTLYAIFELKTFKVSLSANPPQGGWAEELDGPFLYGTTVTIRAYANDNFTFRNWTDKYGGIRSDDSEYPFTVTRDTVLIANFDSDPFMVTLLAEPEEGGVVWSTDTTDIPFLTPVTITAEPDNCYNFLYWTEADTVVSENSAYTFEIEHDRTFTAVFEVKNLMVTALANTGGTVDIDTVYIDCGEELTITAFPERGYLFVNWTENGEEFSTDNPLIFNVSDSLNLVANFEYVTYYIALDKTPHLGGSVHTAGFYPINDTLTVYASPNPGYKFVRWMEEDAIESLNADYQFIVDRDRALTAHFTNDSLDVILSVNNSNFGSIEGGGTDIPYGTTITIKATPEENYKFINWTEEDGSEYSRRDSLTFLVIRSLNLTANFEPKGYLVKLSVNPAPGGTVIGESIVDFGTQHTIMAIPNSQYEYVFDNWTDLDNGDEITQPTYEFMVERDYNFVANFIPQYCKITVSAEPTIGGNAFGGEDDIDKGTPLTVYAEPFDHYVFVKWTENGDSVHNGLEYEFIVLKDRNLTAHFEKETIIITLSAEPPQAAATLTGDSTYYHGDHVTVEATPNEHYYFLNWTVNGEYVTDENPHLFSAEQSGEWVANFDTNSYTITLLSEPPDVATFKGGGTFTYGKQTTIQTTPDICYEFVEWTEADTTVTDCTFMVDRNRTFIAHFTQKQINITTAANLIEGGTAFPENSNPECGTEITVNAEPYEGYNFVNWTEEDEVVCETPDYTFDATRSRDLMANFTPNIYNITIIVDPPEFGSVTGGGSIPYGEEITLHATPGDNYDFVSWTEEDTVVSTNVAYKFTVTGSRTLTANFEVIRLDFDTYATTLWNNTFMLNLKKLEEELEEEYGKITGCKWFKNDIELKITNTIDQFSYSAGSKKGDLLEIAPTYYSFLITTGTGELRYSTKKVLTNINPAPTKNQLLVYPNPTWSGSAFTIERLTKDTYIEVYNQYGVCLSRTIATDEVATLSLDLPSGVYFIRNNHKEAKVVIIR